MATKKRPVDEPAKDWEKTLEPVRKLAAIIRAVEKVEKVPHAALPAGDCPRAIEGLESAKACNIQAVTDIRRCACLFCSSLCRIR